MSYIFKQKFDLNDLVSQPQVEFKTILVAEPEEYLLNLYCDYLSNHNYIPHACSHINLLESKTVLHRPDLLLLSLDLFADKNKISNDFFNYRKQFPHIKILCLGQNVDSEIVKKVMEFGVSSFVERRFSTPQDVVNLVKSIF
jgi:DNA-binding NarL/FixJ family response regulator